MGLHMNTNSYPSPNTSSVMLSTPLNFLIGEKQRKGHYCYLPLYLQCQLRTVMMIYTNQRLYQKHKLFSSPIIIVSYLEARDEVVITICLFLACILIIQLCYFHPWHPFPYFPVLTGFQLQRNQKRTQVNITAYIHKGKSK